MHPEALKLAYGEIGLGLWLIAAKPWRKDAVAAGKR
jgi:hypothetical protein